MRDNEIKELKIKENKSSNIDQVMQHRLRTPENPMSMTLDFSPMRKERIMATDLSTCSPTKKTKPDDPKDH